MVGVEIAAVIAGGLAGSRVGIRGKVSNAARWLGGIVGGIGGMAAWLAALAAWRHCLAALAALWRHGGMVSGIGGMAGGIGGIVGGMAALWRHWRHCGGIGGIADLQLPRSPLVSVLPLWAGDEGCTICSRAWCRKDAQGKVW